MRSGGPERRRLGMLMLPLRLFFGSTFLYAGFDKLLDPTFLDPNAAGSIVAQMHGFALHSPLRPLVEAVGFQFPVLIGVLIAMVEIGVGIGALTGIGFRLAAFGGLAISVLFWLTASWTTHPYYFGGDLPYAFGWLTLLLVGDCGVFTLTPVVERAWVALNAPEEPLPARRNPRWRDQRRTRAPVGRPAVTGTDSMSRRMMLQAGVLAAAAIVLGGVTRFLAPGASSLAAPGTTPGPAGGTPLATQVPAASPPVRGPVGSPSAIPSAIPPAPPAGKLIARVADVQRRGSATFTVPSVGDPGVVVRLRDGSFAAFDATCTHAGCPVSYIAGYKALVCPCHGAVFDPNDHGAVLQGPARDPLTELPITVDQATGQIYLRA
jgi:thiosulfate dehydrogenase (quinone) large subunit